MIKLSMGCLLPFTSLSISLCRRSAGISMIEPSYVTLVDHATVNVSFSQLTLGGESVDRVQSER